VNSTGSAVTVRLAGQRDLLAVLGIHARRESDGSPPERVSEIEGETWGYMLETSGMYVYLCELNGEAVGTASAMLFPNITYDCRPTAIIEAVVVAHPYRRQGVATFLLQRILHDMRAHRLYSSLGFEPEAEGFRLYLARVPEAVEQARRGS
jgi:GNAT superfamily N-acetyltransferase